MKGEFVGADGRKNEVQHIMVLHDNAALWHVTLGHPDFPAAVAALQARIQPSLDPRAGRVREEAYRFCAGGLEYEVLDDGVLLVRIEGDRYALAGTGSQALLDAGRRYERERGCAYVSDKPWTHQS